MRSTRGLATCTECHQLIRWTLTDAGNRMAVNPEPDEGGNTAVYRDAHGTWRSRRPSDELPITAWEWLAMPHVATCTRRKDGTQPLPNGVTSLAAHRRTRRRRRT